MAFEKSAPPGVTVTGAAQPGYEKILTPDAITFLAALERKFGPERKRLLARRAEVQARLDEGWKPDFLAETRGVRESDWTVAPLPKDRLDRRGGSHGAGGRHMAETGRN